MVRGHLGETFPAAGGTYVLMLECLCSGTCRVGRFGNLAVSAGRYFYVGSALGPGGLRSRLGRHVRPLARRHWHVDFLRELATVRGVWWLGDGRRLEHVWATALARDPRFTAPVPGFGASDCHCNAHLFRLLAADVPDVRHLLAAASGADHRDIGQWCLPAGEAGRHGSERP